MVVSNILDPVHDTLDPSVWDAVHEHYPVLMSQHKHWVIDKVHEVLKEHGYGDMDRWLEVYLTGSLTTYQYSADSDCDISLFVNTDVFPEWSRAEMIGVMVSHFDGTTLPGTTHPMQGYVVAKGIRPNDLYKPGLRSGYLIERDQWIVPPEKGRSHNVEQEQNGDYQWALEQADKMERLLRYEPDKAVTFWRQIHMRRMSDQKMGKGDYSQSNIIYKFLANRGLFPQISDVSGEHIAKTAGVPGWQPGEYGKFIITPQGEVHHWRTNIASEFNDPADARPHHGEYIRHVLAPRYQEYMNDGDEDGDKWTPGWIDPEGRVSTLSWPRGLHERRAQFHVLPEVPGTRLDSREQNVLDRMPVMAHVAGAFFNDDEAREDPDSEAERQERLRIRNTPDMMYHVAPMERRDSIVQNGLLPDAERINNESNHPAGVYLWDDPEVAMKYRGQGPNMYRDMDIHAVQVPRAGLTEDPWFYENHQDRANDFPGGYYSPDAITADRIQKFYDSPWHKRGTQHMAKTAGFFPHSDRVDEARQRLNIEHPVRFMPTYRDTVRGGYAGMSRDPATGQDSHLIYFNPDQNPGARNWAAWHELAHAMQYERDGTFEPTTDMPYKKYLYTPTELEAEMVPRQHADTDLWDPPHHRAASEKPRVLYNKFTPQNSHPPTDARGTATLPFIYDPSDDIVHLGPANSYHWELIQRTPELRVQYPMDKAYQGFSALSVPSHLHGRLEWPAKHTDFMGLTSDNKHHRDAVNAALGATDKPDESWHDVFQSNTEGPYVGQDSAHTGRTSRESAGAIR